MHQKQYVDLNCVLFTTSNWTVKSSRLICKVPLITIKNPNIIFSSCVSYHSTFRFYLPKAWICTGDHSVVHSRPFHLHMKIYAPINLFWREIRRGQILHIPHIPTMIIKTGRVRSDYRHFCFSGTARPGSKIPSFNGTQVVVLFTFHFLRSHTTWHKPTLLTILH